MGGKVSGWVYARACDNQTGRDRQILRHTESIVNRSKPTDSHDAVTLPPLSLSPDSVTVHSPLLLQCASMAEPREHTDREWGDETQHDRERDTQRG